MKKGKLLMAFAAIALVLTGCNKDKGDTRTPEQKVDAAIEAVRNDWKAGKYAEDGVIEDFALMTSVDGISGVTITYTSDNAAVRISEDNKTAIVTRPEHDQSDALVTLTANFVCEKVSKDTKLGVMVLKKAAPVDETSVAEIQAAKDGTVVSMTGIVVGRSILDPKYDNFTAYVQHATEGGLYIYRAPGSDYDKLAVGNQVKVTGTKGSYSGLVQIAASTKETWQVEVLAENQTLPEYKDVTSAISSAEDNTKVSTLLQSTLVQLTGFRVTSVEQATIVDGVLDGSFNVLGMVGNTETMIRVKDDISESAALASTFQGFTAGDVLTVKGVGDWYNEFQLVPFSVEKTGNEEFTDQEKVDMAKESFSFNTSSVTADFKLPVTADHGVTVSWSSNNAAIAVNDENAMVTRGEEDVTVTLTATFTLNDATATKTYEVTVVGTNSQENTTVLTRESLFAGKTGNSYADYNGDYVVNGHTVTTTAIMANDNYAERQVLQFAKVGHDAGTGTLTVKNIEVTTITLKCISSFPYESNFSFKLGETNLEIESVTSEGTGVFSGEYEFNEYTVTVTLDAATTGDLVIANATSFTQYVSSITIG